MKYILILFVLNGAGSPDGVSMQEFNSINNCKYALTYAKSTSSYIKGECLPKGWKK